MSSRLRQYAQQNAAIEEAGAYTAADGTEVVVRDRREPGARPRIREALRRRAGRVLTVAAHHHVTRLVRGAWGCGVFGNDPAEVADAFGEQVEGRFAGAFDHVVLAVWNRTGPSANRTAFGERFTAPC